MNKLTGSALLLIAGFAGSAHSQVFISGSSDANPWVDRIGWAGALLALLGVLGHGALRVVNRRAH